MKSRIALWPLALLAVGGMLIAGCMGAWLLTRPRTIRVRVAADPSVRAIEGWEQALRARFRAVSALYENQIGIRWVIAEVVPWLPGTDPGLDSRRSWLRVEIGPGKADLLIGFTTQGEGGRAASVLPFSSTGIIVYDANLPENQNTRILAHELAHAFGAVHGPWTAGTLMGEPPDGPTFDSATAEMIRRVRNFDFARGLQGPTATGDRGAAEALARLFQGVARIPLAHAHHILGASCQSDDRTKPALAHLREAVRLDPQLAAARIDLAKALAPESGADEAIGQLREAARLDPDNVEAHALLGSMLARLKQHEDAVDEIATALRLKPEDASLHLLMGTLLMEGIGQLDGAIAAFETAQQLTPAWKAPRLALDGALQAKRQAEALVISSTAAVRSRPRDADAHYNLGVAMTRVGDLTGARNSFRKAIEINPAHAQAHSNLAVLSYVTGDYESAWRETRTAQKFGKEPDPRFLAALRSRKPG